MTASLQKTPFRSAGLFRAVAAAWAVFLTSAGSFAATITWQGNGGTANWNTTNRWSTGSVPGSADIARFNASTTLDPVINANYTVGQLLFTTGTDAEAFTGTGTLTLAGVSGVGIDNQGTATHTFANNFAISSSQVWRNTNATNGDMTFSGTLNLNGNTLTLTNTNAVNTMSLSGVISGSGALSLGGAGSVTLSGANTYSGGTTLSGGTLTAASNNALGTGTLSITGASTLSASGNRTLTNTVAASSNFTIGGTSNLTMSGAIGLGAGNRTITVSNSATTTFSGVVDNDYYANVTKEGTGRLVLSGANTFDGSFILNGGTVSLQNNSALGTSTWGNVVASGATLEFANNVTITEGGFTVSGAGYGSAGALSNLSGTNTLNGQVVLGGATTFSSTAGSLTLTGQIDNAGYLLTAGGAGNLAFTSQLYGSGGLTKTGAGTLTLTGPNSYNGATTISGGTVVIGNATGLGSNAAGTTIGAGATLGLQGCITVAGESLTISGAGGTLSNVSGNNIWNNSITYSAAGNISATAGTLTIGQHDPNSLSNPETDTIAMGTNALTVNVASGANVDIQNSITGTSATLTKTGAGTLTLSGLYNSFTGTTTVTEGTLLLDTRSVAFAPTYVYQNQGLSGNVVIGDDNTGNGTALLQFGTTWGGDKLADTINVRVNSDGTLNLNGVSDLIGSLTVKGGLVQTGAGTLQVNGNIDFLSSASTGTITGFLSFNGGTRNIDVATGTTARIDATMNAGGYVKTGTGTLIVTANDVSTYSGTTTVSEGVLNVRADNALGQGNTSNSASGTYVSSGAALQLQNGINIANEYLQLGSTGISNDGGLRNISGNNTWAGSVVLGGTSRINSDSGTLTLSGNTLNMATSALTFGGAGDISVSKVIASDNTTFGNVTKDGTGTLYLSGNSTYKGNTLITQGVVDISHGFALGSAAGTTTISSGATLQINNNITTGESITLAGSGYGSTGGAIVNTGGNNTISGNLTMTGATTVASNSGTLTLSGSVGGAGQNLIVTGSGNTTVSGVIGTGSGTVTKNGAGTLTLSGVNTYTGLTSVNAGTLEFGNNSILGTSNNIFIGASGTLDLNSFTQSISTIAGTGVVNFDGANLTLNGATTFSGSFTGVGTIYLGAGSSLTLGANFDASGINIVLNGGSLFLNNTTSTFGNLTVNSSSTIDFGSGASVVQFSNVTANANLSVTNWTNMVDYFYSSSSAGTQGSAPLNNIVFTGWTGNNTTWQPFDSGPLGDNQITPVPEPEVYGAAFVSGLLALVAYRRRAKRAERAGAR